MGFFDFVCPLSGLSLRAARAVQVPLIESTPGRWWPLGLPLLGTYDRLGSIDGFTPDFRTDLLVAGFATMAAAGRVDARSVPDEFAEFTRTPALAPLLQMFERATTMARHAPMTFTLDGRPLRQTLIHAEAFAALAPENRLPRAPSADDLAKQLARAPVAPQARELFAAVVRTDDATRTAASIALNQLGAVTDWLSARRRRWSPSTESGQYGPAEDLRFARRARGRLADAPELLAAVDREIDLLEREG